MVPFLRRVRQHAMVALAATLLTACGTAQALRCTTASEQRPPRNFGSVLATAGGQTTIFRGGQPETCGELEYLRSIGVKSILKLNDRGLPMDADEKARATALGFRVQSFAFNAATIGSAPTCGPVREALAFARDRGNWPVFVHCTAGKDRTGYIVGLFEKLVLGRSADAVLGELHRYGHTGIRSILFGQIDRELASPAPVCSR